MRYPLVDGQGNFGSIDNDPPAAMRYTEARLARLATEMLRDIDADTVDFGPELRRLAASSRWCCRRASRTCSSTAPSGIAVGMATNIPPHNLRETIDATVAYIDDPEIDVVGPDEAHQGPGLPDRRHDRRARQGIKEAYETGRGRVVVRAKAHIEPLRQGKEAIIVTEMPYQVSKGDGRNDGSGLIKKIAEVVKDGKIPRDLRPARRVRQVAASAWSSS